MLTAVVIDLSLEHAGQWLALLVSVTIIAGAIWSFGRAVYVCFDRTFKSVEALSVKIDQEAMVQHYRHEANVGRFTALEHELDKLETRIESVSGDVGSLETRVAANTARLGKNR